MPGQSRRLTNKVVLSAVGLVLTTGLIGAVLLAQQRDQTLTQGQRLTNAFAKVIDEQTSRNLQTIDQHIELMAQLLSEVRAQDDAQASGASRLVQAQADSLAFIDNVMVLDAQGQVALASRTDLRGIEVGVKDFATIYKTRPGTGFYVGAPLLNRDGQWLLPTGRPLTKERDGYAGVLVVTVKASYFDQLWATLSLDSGSSIGLLRSDGTMLMRSPIDGTAMGRNFTDSPLFLQHLPASANGDYRITSPVDGIDRFTAYRTLSQRPDLVVIVGRTMDALLAPWYQLVKLMLGIWLAGSLILMVLAVRLSRQSAHRQRAENTSIALAQRLNVACEAAGLVLWEWDLRTDQWHVTPTHYTSLGYTAQSAQVTRMQWLELLHPDDRKLPTTDPAMALSQADQRYEHEFRMRHADGSYRWMRTAGQVKEWDKQGHPLRMVGIRTDVTDRINAEHERRQMFERISDALVGVNTDWVITYANARAGRLLGHAVEDLVGKNVWSLFPQSSGHQFQPVYERCMASQRPEVFEEHYEPAGVWYESHIYPSPEGLSIYFRDITDRKKSEKALIDAKDQAENLINGANVMVVGLDARGQITIFNKAAQELTGYTMADLAGLNWFDVLVPRERYPEVHAEFARLSSGGLPAQFDNPILTKSHEERQISWQNSVLRDGDVVTGILSFGMDVTARNRAELALAESREQFELLARHSLQGIALVRTAQMSYVNPAFCTIAGRSAAELSRLSITQMLQWIHPDDREGSRHRQRRRLAGQSVDEVNEIRILTGQGEWRWIQLATRSITMSGAPTLIAMVLDIHDRRQAEDALRTSEERFRSAFDASAVGMGLTALDGRWMQVNPSLCRIVGYSAQELCRHTFMEITHPDDLADDLLEVEQLRTGRIPHFTKEKRYLHRDGHPVWVNLTMALVHDASGRPLHTVAHVEDISDRKRLEQELRDSEELMRQMAESVSQMFFLADLFEHRFLYVSPAAEAVLGCRPADLLADPAVWRQSIHPDDRERVAQVVQQGMRGGRYDMQFRIATAPDVVRWVHARSFPVLGAHGKPYRSAGVVEDITARKILEIREEQEHAILQYLASGRPIAEVLEKFVLGYETMLPGMHGSILLMDPDGMHLRHGAAPHLPLAFCEAVEGLAIGPLAGSCGTAAFTGEAVMATDIASDPRWIGHHELALENGLQACWSVPIKGAQGKVLGAFAFYFDHPRQPSDAEALAIAHGAQLASQVLQRHLAVQGLQRSEERYRTVVEWSPMGIMIHQAGRIVFCNPAALETHGATTTQDMIGRQALDLVHPQDRATFARLSKHVLEDNQSTEETEIRALQIDGKLIDLQIKMAPTLFDGNAAVQVVMFDITERKRAQAELRNSQRQLRVLSSRVLAAQETERRRVAHELHDELGQSLTAIKINLQSQLRLASGESGELFAENIRIVEQALQEVRNLALALRPSMLDDLGLVSALRWLTNQVRQRNTMDVQLEVSDGVGRLAPDLETAAFRIVQEALTNVERHAGASKVEVSASIDADRTLVVRIKDDGAGFDVAAMRERATSGASMGVLGMSERASLAGGALTIEASAGKGCCVTLRCPLADPGNH